MSFANLYEHSPNFNIFPNVNIFLEKKINTIFFCHLKISLLIRHQRVQNRISEVLESSHMRPKLTWVP